MNKQLHQTTLNLMSLIQFYQRASGDNEKIRCAIEFSQSLAKEGLEASGEKQKLQFCADAVEAITSVVAQRTSEDAKAQHTTPLLDRDEIDFIQDMLLSDVSHEDGTQSDEVNNRYKMDLYGT